MTHISISPIELYSHLHERETFEDVTRRKLSLRPKIKIHGTNGCVRVETDGSVRAQGKTQNLTAEEDYKGFGAWVESQAGIWTEVASDETITFFGEWAGPGIAKGTAIQKTDRKRFYIFHVGIGQMDDPRRPGAVIPRWIITCPDQIEAMMPLGIDRDTVRILPYEGIPYEFNFASEENLDYVLRDLNAAVDLLEVRDPYVMRTFGVEGEGEGYVLVPHATQPGEVSGNDFSRLAFKAKTDKHRVQKQPKAASKPEPLPQTAFDLISTFVTEPRLDQAIETVADGVADKRATGKVIAWMTADIEKEAQAEISALGIPFEKLRGEIANATRDMLFARIPA